MSDLPPGWEWTTFGAIAETCLGKMLDRSKFTGSNSVPYLRNVNVQWGRFDLGDILTIEIPPERQSFFEVRPDDLMVCEGGEIGRCAIWPGGKAYMAFQKALHRVRPHPGVDVRFLRYLLEHYSHTNTLARYSTGSTIKHLPQQQLRRMPLPLPPYAEQRRIVAALEHHFSNLEAAEQLLDRANRQTDLAVASLLAAAFSGKLATPPPGTEINGDGLRVATLESRELLRSDDDKRGRPNALPPAQQLGFEIPEHWGVVSLEEATHPNRTISYGILKPGPNLSDGVPYVRVINMRGDEISIKNLHRTSREIDQKYSRARLVLGDVLLSIRGTFGRVAVVSKSLAGANITQDTARLSFVDTVDPRFAAYYLRSPGAQTYFSHVARGVAVKGVNIGDLREMPMPLPSLTEQRQIVWKISEVLSDIRVAKNGVQHAQIQARQLRKEILLEAFLGRLAPQDQDDEPAGILLARIRAELATQARPKRSWAQKRE